METIGSRIKQLRKNKKLTQQQVADYVGVSKTSVIYWEKDETIPKHESLLLLAKKLEVHTDYIMYGESSTQSQTLGTMTQSQSGQSQSQGNNFNDSPELQKLIELLRDKNPSKDVLKHLEQTLELVTKAQESKDQVANGTAPDTKTA